MPTCSSLEQTHNYFERLFTNLAQCPKSFCTLIDMQQIILTRPNSLSASSSQQIMSPKILGHWAMCNKMVDFESLKQPRWISFCTILLTTYNLSLKHHASNAIFPTPRSSYDKISFVSLSLSSHYQSEHFFLSDIAFRLSFSHYRSEHFFPSITTVCPLGILTVSLSPRSVCSWILNSSHNQYHFNQNFKE
jgi:hypothetical protein